MARPRKSGRIAEGCVIKTVKELIAEYGKYDENGHLVIKRKCLRCGKDFCIDGGVTGRIQGYDKRRYCDECVAESRRTRPHKYIGRATDFSEDFSTLDERQFLHSCSPFRDHGPAPLPKDKVPPHRHRQERVWNRYDWRFGAVKVTSRR